MRNLKNSQKAIYPTGRYFYRLRYNSIKSIKYSCNMLLDWMYSLNLEHWCVSYFQRCRVAIQFFCLLADNWLEGRHYTEEFAHLLTVRLHLRLLRAAISPMFLMRMLPCVVPWSGDQTFLLSLQSRRWRMILDLLPFSKAEAPKYSRMLPNRGDLLWYSNFHSLIVREVNQQVNGTPNKNGKTSYSRDDQYVKV